MRNDSSEDQSMLVYRSTHKRVATTNVFLNNVLTGACVLAVCPSALYDSISSKKLQHNPKGLPHALMLESFSVVPCTTPKSFQNQSNLDGIFKMAIVYPFGDLTADVCPLKI